MHRTFRVLLGLMLVVLCGCGGSSSNSPNSQVQIVFWSAPPASLQVGATANVAAKVSNDPSNAGVTWSCAPSDSCGTFSPATTMSAYSTTYTAPVTAPSGGSVTITATSLADSSVSTTSTSISLTPVPISVIYVGDPPPSILPPSSTLSVNALVSNDDANAGVTWSCVPLGSCGSFGSTTTPSLTPDLYTAPATAPANGQVTITATSITDPTKFASISVSVTGTASPATLNGQYAYSLTAPNGTHGAVSLAGSVTLDGAGNITSGIQDLVTPLASTLNDPVLAVCPEPNSSSSIYQVDPSGHGRMRVCTAGGVRAIFSFVLTSPYHASIIEADGNPASGTLDLQNPTTTGFAPSQVTGPYSLTLTGADAVTPDTRTSIGASLILDDSSNLASGQLDVNLGGTVTSTVLSAGSATPPDANGRGTITLPGVGRTFIYYIVSSKALRLIESDGVTLAGGSAFAQGTETFLFTGAFVYQHSGWNSFGFNAAAGQFAYNENGVISITSSDATLAGTPITPVTGVSVRVTRLMHGNRLGILTMTDASGSSRFNFYAVDSSLNILDPNQPADLTGSSGGLLLLHTDAYLNGVGQVLHQTPSPFLGYEVINLQNYINGNAASNELDLVGVGLADGVQSINSGAADYDQNASDPILNVPLVAIFQPDLAHPGRYLGNINVPAFGTITDYFFIPDAPPNFNVSFYQISPTQAFIVETDGFAIVTGTMVQQVLP